VAKCPRKLFTQRRQIKVQGFIESYMNDPKKLEACGSDTWFQELLEAVGEPGVVMLENVRHWVEINSDAFYVSIFSSYYRSPRHIYPSFLLLKVALFHISYRFHRTGTHRYSAKHPNQREMLRLKLKGNLGKDGSEARKQ